MTFSPDVDRSNEFLEIFASLVVAPLQLRMEWTPAPMSAPWLRGALGAGLRAIARVVYDRCFHPSEDGRLPGYVLRNGESNVGWDDDRWPELTSDVECLLIGEAARHERQFLRALDYAAGYNAADQRTSRGEVGGRQPRFLVNETRRWAPHDARWARHEGSAPELTLADLITGSSQDLRGSSLRLETRSPLVLVHEHRLVHSPKVVDVVAKLCRRIRAFLPEPIRPRWDELKEHAIQRARQISAKFHCERVAHLTCRTYGGHGTPDVGAKDAMLNRSNVETPRPMPELPKRPRKIPIDGVLGHWQLPDGVDDLSPLLAALDWLHVGKMTIDGLGRCSLISGR